MAVDVVMQGGRKPCLEKDTESGGMLRGGSPVRGQTAAGGTGARVPSALLGTEG